MRNRKENSLILEEHPSFETNTSALVFKLQGKSSVCTVTRATAFEAPAGHFLHLRGAPGCPRHTFRGFLKGPSYSRKSSVIFLAIVVFLLPFLYPGKLLTRRSQKSAKISVSISFD